MVDETAQPHRSDSTSPWHLMTSALTAIYQLKESTPAAKRKRRLEKEEADRREKLVARALLFPRYRPRSLTNQGQHPQSQSDLVARLPLEIRLIIWKYVLDIRGENGVLHTTNQGNCLLFWPCKSKHDRFGRGDECWQRERITYRLGCSTATASSEDIQKCNPLLQTCKLIYNESSGILFRCSTFDFTGVWDISNLPDIMLPSRLQAIRYITFGMEVQMPLLAPSVERSDCERNEDWPAACQVLATLENIQSLRVDFVFVGRERYGRYGDAAPAKEGYRSLFEPLMDVRAREILVLHNMPKQEELLEGLEPLPFIVKHRDITDANVGV